MKWLKNLKRCLHNRHSQQSNFNINHLGRGLESAGKATIITRRKEIKPRVSDFIALYSFHLINATFSIFSEISATSFKAKKRHNHRKIYPTFFCRLLDASSQSLSFDNGNKQIYFFGWKYLFSRGGFLLQRAYNILRLFAYSMKQNKSQNLITRYWYCFGDECYSNHQKKKYLTGVEKKAKKAENQYDANLTISIFCF